jgi:hypothetical protein
MYMPGRLRTASSPSSTVIEEALYPFPDFAELRGWVLTGAVRLLDAGVDPDGVCADARGPWRGLLLHLTGRADENRV